MWSVGFQITACDVSVSDKIPVVLVTERILLAFVALLLSESLRWMRLDKLSFVSGDGYMIEFARSTIPSATWRGSLFFRSLVAT